jgi:hypothetical protein
MRADLRPLLGFCAAILFLDAVLWAYHPRPLVGLLLALPALAAGLAAIAMAGAGEPRGGVRVVPELSPATALTAVAFAVSSAATIFGLWLLLIGLGLGALGIGGLVREIRAGTRGRPW